MGARAPVVYGLTAFFGLRGVLASVSFALGLPWLTYQPPYWRTLLIYGCGAAYIGYLCWRQSPRARFAAYVFLTVDIIRAGRGNHWGTVVIDLVVLSILQLPWVRAVYPSIRPRQLRGRRGSRATSPVNGRPNPHGGEQPTNGHGAAMHP
ncbi:MAG: hypothetical protein ACRERE_13055 [Candidatus Entotheonellia bacterium]